MMACLLGLLRTERLAREMSAVTRVIDILKQGTRITAVLPSNIYLRKNGSVQRSEKKET